MIISVSSEERQLILDSLYGKLMSVDDKWCDIKDESGVKRWRMIRRRISRLIWKIEKTKVLNPPDSERVKNEFRK
jgi:hypothetical protein